MADQTQTSSTQAAVEATANQVTSGASNTTNVNQAAVQQAAHQANVGVLLVEQHVKQALRVADHVLVMQRGQIVLRGATAEVAGVRGQYIG